MESKLRRLIMLYGAATMISDFGYETTSEYKELTDEQKAEIKAIAEQKKLERLKKQGVKEYFYGDKVIYARNKKNADRKSRKKGYL